MWIVLLALRRPYTFVVAAILVAILGAVTILRMPTDIFPEIDIPVISVVFQYAGMSPNDMEKRIVTNYERILTTTVNDIDHIESQSLTGVSVTKIYFQKTAKIEAATAQVTAVSQTALRQMPPGTQPPLIIRYNASSVPIVQLSISSDTIPEQQLFDLTINTMRTQLITVPGVQIPYPYGGRQRQIMVDLDPEKLYAWGISPQDVSNAVNVQNLILPSGTAKIGSQEYPIGLNSSPTKAIELNDLPIKTVKGTTIYIKDVAHVRDGFQVQQSLVHANGKRGVLLSILKNGNASTLDVVNNVKAALPQVKKSLPPDLKVDLLFDQSIFVRASIEGVIKEAVIAAGLTALMILLFLGSWRSTLIVVISIPLSILVSIIILSFLGETLNVMTLGGMALAVGILVDDATVEIENIHRNLHQRKRLVQAILDGAQQIAVPAFVSTLCICIVFVPVVFISGAAKFLFTPLAMAVVFAMMTSYVLSRTLVPTMVHYLLATEVEMYGGQLDPDDPHAAKTIHDKEEREHHPHDGETEQPAAPSPAEPEGLLARIRRHASTRGGKLALLIGVPLAVVGGMVLAWMIGRGSFPWLGHALAGFKGWLVHDPLQKLLYVVILACLVALLYLVGRYGLIWRVHYAFNRQFEKLRRYYGGLLAWSLAHRLIVAGAFLLVVIGSCALLFPLVGRDFFPSVDAGQIRLHVRAPAGTRLESTETIYADVETAIRKRIPANEIETLLDNMGIPNSGINLSLSDGTLMSSADGEILIALKEGHESTAGYIRTLRKDLQKEFPNLTFFFQPPDMVTQVLNFGLSSPIDVQIAGSTRDAEDNAALARELMADLRGTPGVVDLHLQQVTQTPNIGVNVDRTLASQVGVTQKDVASDLLISLSGTLQSAPNFWLNPQNAISYNVLVQTPQYRIDTINSLENTPIQPVSEREGNTDNTQLLGNLATIQRGSEPTNITHYDIKPTFDVQMNVQGTDLGRVAGGVQQIVDKYEKRLQHGSKITLRGQVESMHASFTGLSYGLVFAVLLVYMLMVINFQSWIDPLIILMALPGALAGILWMLFVTGTTISVPALMGAIMSIGVATANSILMITFANDQRKDHGMNAHDAALSAGMTRLRPVMMTALAMIIGMLPMSLGMGEGGEQNAPLGRAVIGGLMMATFATLFFVPIVYSALRAKSPETHVEPELR